MYDSGPVPSPLTLFPVSNKGRGRCVGPAHLTGAVT